MCNQSQLFNIVIEVINGLNKYINKCIDLRYSYCRNVLKIYVRFRYVNTKYMVVIQGSDEVNENTSRDIIELVENKIVEINELIDDELEDSKCSNGKR